MNKGISLVELLVGIGLSAFVFLMVSGILVSITDSRIKSKQQERLEQIKNDLFMELSNNIKWAKQVQVSPNTIYVCHREVEPGMCGQGAENAADITYVYTPTEGSITKNGSSLTPENIQVNTFQVVERSGGMDLKSLEINIGISDTRSVWTDNVTVVVSQRRTSLEVN